MIHVSKTHRNGLVSACEQTCGFPHTKVHDAAKCKLEAFVRMLATMNIICEKIGQARGRRELSLSISENTSVKNYCATYI